MKTNLVFKRSIVVDGINKVEMKLVEVDIPQIVSTEGWILSGHTDSIDISDAVNKKEEIITEQPKKLVFGDKFQSAVPGTSKLVRSNGSIFITFRKGKTTYNETTPNSVCIGDTVKTQFFSSCRKTLGQDCTSFKFTEGKHEIYDFWNSFMDEEYKKQLQYYNDNLTRLSS